MQPDIVVTEDVFKHPSKGARSKRLIATIADVARNSHVLDITIQRTQKFTNKYEEAKALAAQFPDLLPWVPTQPRIWESEPLNTIYFEALGMALDVLKSER